MNLQATTAIGDNRLPLISDDQLNRDHAKLLADLEALAAKYADAPKEIADDKAHGLVGDLVVALRGIERRAKDSHKVEKDPFLAAGRAVDGFFNRVIERAAQLKNTLELRGRDYLKKKEDAARRERERIEREAREAADRARMEAEAAAAFGADEHIEQARDDAFDAEQAARAASEAASAKPADLTRTRSDSGRVSSLAENWQFEITEFAKIDLEALRPYLPRADLEKSIRAFVRTNKGGRPLAGVRIFDAGKANFR